MHCAASMPRLRRVPCMGDWLNFWHKEDQSHLILFVAYPTLESSSLPGAAPVWWTISETENLDKLCVYVGGYHMDNLVKHVWDHCVPLETMLCHTWSSQQITTSVLLPCGRNQNQTTPESGWNESDKFTRAWEIDLKRNDREITIEELQKTRVTGLLRNQVR